MKKTKLKVANPRFLIIIFIIIAAIRIAAIMIWTIIINAAVMIMKLVVVIVIIIIIGFQKYWAVKIIFKRIITTSIEISVKKKLSLSYNNKKMLNGRRKRMIWKNIWILYKCLIIASFWILHFKSSLATD